jgi:hypothetical protein
MTKPAFLEPRSAAVLAHMVAVDRPVTAGEIGRDSGLYPRGTPQIWTELGRSLASRCSSTASPSSPAGCRSASRSRSAAASRSRSSASSPPGSLKEAPMANLVDTLGSWARAREYRRQNERDLHVRAVLAAEREAAAKERIADVLEAQATIKSKEPAQ